MKKYYKILLIATLLLIILLPSKVKADSFKLNLTADKTALKPGDTVVLNLNLSDIIAEDPGINTLEAVLEYDTSIFEEVTQNSIQAVNNWSITYNNEETDNKGKLLAVIVTAGVKDNQDIGKITLKVKSGISNTNTTVKLTQITSNNGKVMITESDKQVSFEVKTNQSSNGSNNNQNNNDKDSGSTSKNLVGQQNLSQGPLPQTGSQVGNLFWVLGIAVLLIVIAIIYVRYKKIDK